MAEVGLFGGTFDPVHLGHLECADAALQETSITSVIFIPAASPPHKDDTSVCNFAHRLAMLKLCVAGNDAYNVSDIEGRRPLPSYTLDTIHVFKEKDKQTRYHFIIGCDAFLEIESWYRWQEVASSINFIVVIRPGYPVAHLNATLKRIGFFQEPVNEGSWFNQKGPNKIQLLSARTQDISSSDIRTRIRANRSWKLSVTKGVADYITKNELYR